MQSSQDLKICSLTLHSIVKWYYRIAVEGIGVFLICSILISECMCLITNMKIWMNQNSEVKRGTEEQPF